MVFFDICGVAQREFVPQSQTVDAKYYCDVLRHLRGNVCRNDVNCDVLITGLYNIAFFMLKVHSYHSPPLLLDRFGALQLLSVP